PPPARSPPPSRPAPSTSSAGPAGGCSRRSRNRTGKAGRLRRRDPPAAGDAAALALGSAAPDTVVDPVVDRVLQALLLHRAVLADLAGDLDAHAVTWEEQGRLHCAAVAPCHPLAVHVASVCPRA